MIVVTERQKRQQYVKLGEVLEKDTANLLASVSAFMYYVMTNINSEVLRKSHIDCVWWCEISIMKSWIDHVSTRNLVSNC